MRLECIRITSGGLMKRISGPYPDNIANLYISKHTKGFSVFVKKDLPWEIRTKLRAIPANKAFNNPKPIKDILGNLYVEDTPRKYISYIFPHNLNPESFLDAIILDSSHIKLFRQFEPTSKFPKHPAFGIIINNKLVCVCESSKENDEAAESWVRTLKADRRRGYAKQATLTWAYNLQQRGKTPFYSHKTFNTQSQRLAKNLCLIQYSNETCY